MAHANPLCMRIFMHVLTLVVHISNAIFVDAMYEKEANDPLVKLFYPLQYRYYTVWNVIMQIVYAVIGLICDGLALTNTQNKEYKILKYLENIRNYYFSVLVLPATGGVFTVYWTLYNYDKSLVCLPFVDKIITPISDHVIHTFILPVVLWEMWLQPRKVPRSHGMNFSLLSLIVGVSWTVPPLTYSSYGVWIYPFFEVFYGSIYLFMVLIFMYLSVIGFYFIQWPIVRMLWPQNIEEKVE